MAGLNGQSVRRGRAGHAPHRGRPEPPLEPCQETHRPAEPRDRTVMSAESEILLGEQSQALPARREPGERRLDGAGRNLAVDRGDQGVEFCLHRGERGRGRRGIADVPSERELRTGLAGNDDVPVRLCRTGVRLVVPGREVRRHGTAGPERGIENASRGVLREREAAPRAGGSRTNRDDVASGGEKEAGGDVVATEVRGRGTPGAERSVERAVAVVPHEREVAGAPAPADAGGDELTV